MDNTNYYIGCSGYYYPSWKNKFYPQGLQPKNWLNYYSTVFNSVELNGTFYRTPKPTDLTKYKEVTPDNFKFSVKVSKYITHILKLKDTKHQIHDFQNLINEGLENKCSHFLFQLPPTFQYNKENLDRILDNIPHHPNNVIELRHISWWNEEVLKAFVKAKFTFCNVDFPGLDSYFIHSSSCFYLRMHGNPELFKSIYSKERLKKIYENFPIGSKSYSIYFNNTTYEGGYTNARQMMELVLQ
jgi:uncharacterized protein YecE (DUF72 family)